MTGLLFISDLHLDPSRPRATDAFLRFLSGDARHAEHLYILGDLFEFWIGDDDDSVLAGTVLDALGAYNRAGGRCSVMRGNRDFLLGHRFEQRTGARLLTDPTLVEIAGQRVLLMHGDLLCTDDHAYQRYRRVVNSRLLQPLFLSLPRAWRRAAGTEGRRRSRAYTAGRPPTITDVNAQAVEATVVAHQAQVLIHGHTHRPGIHRFTTAGGAATRVVLGDWFEQGSVLRWDAGGRELANLPFG